MAATAPRIDAPLAAPTVEEALAAIRAPQGWKRRLEDPANTFLRYPIALALTRLLVRTPVTPNQISCAQPVFAGIAGYLVTLGDYRADLLAVAMFELRSILDCVDGTLARAKRMSSPYGHAIDGLADWLGVVLLYAGIFVRFHTHAPEGALGGGSLLSWLGVHGVLVLAILSGAARSFTSDYFRVKFVSVFDGGTDDTEATLRQKILALRPGAPFFAHAEVLIGKLGHLTFNHEWLTREKAAAAPQVDAVAALRREESSPRVRRLAFLWSISNGDAFLTYVMVALLLDRLWLLQELYATIGVVTIVALCAASSSFVKGVTRRSAGVVAAA